MQTNCSIAEYLQWFKYGGELNPPVLLNAHGDRFNGATGTYYQDSSPINVTRAWPKVVTKKTLSKDYRCPRCPTKVYVSARNLARHMSFECGEECKFACPYCKKKIRRRESVYSHIRTYHNGKREYADELY